jgi:cobalt/nickel transport system permease protein
MPAGKNGADMHISEGVLSLPVLAGGAVCAVAGLACSLKKLPWNRLMSVGILSSAFFVASLIHVPLGPGSVHLIMNGLLGALLGWAALPAISVALFLQALLFQFGGLFCLGVNITIMAWPAVICGLLFRPFFPKGTEALPDARGIPSPEKFRLRRFFSGNRLRRAAAPFACGALSVLCSALLCALALALSGERFVTAAWAILLAHVPIMIIEGLLTAAVVATLARVLPELLSPDSAGREE